MPVRPVTLVGEHSAVAEKRDAASARGARGRENVGMSNDNGGEKPPRRKTKVSGDDANQNRVSRVLRRTREGRADGERVNTPVLAPVCDGGTEVRKACPVTEYRVEGG